MCIHAFDFLVLIHRDLEHFKLVKLLVKLHNVPPQLSAKETLTAELEFFFKNQKEK